MRRMMLAAALITTLLHNRPVLAQVPPAKPDRVQDPRQGEVVQPSSPLAILDLVRQAQEKGTARAWPEAAAQWEQVVRLNPVQPNYWYSLGAAHYNARNYRAAIPAFEKAAALGAPIMGAYYSVYQIARCHARAGDKDLALAALERAFTLGYPSLSQPATDPELASLRADPRFRKLLGLEDVSKMSREEGWRYDLALLAQEVKRKGFNPHLYVNRPVSWDQFHTKVQELHHAIPKLSDGQIILEMMKLMVFLEDGHSAVWDNEGVPPDVEVEQWPADLQAGRDPQLEKAIEIILKELAKNPPAKVQRPPYPVRVRKPG